MSLDHHTDYYIIYNTATGEERMRGSVPAGMAAMQHVPDGHQIIILPQDVWTLPPAEAVGGYRTALWERVKLIRDAVIAGGAPTPFGTVDCDTEGRSNISGASTAAIIATISDQPFSITWTLQDNSLVTLDASQMMALGLAVVGHVNAAHERARVLRAALDEAQDVPALLQIDVGAGWVGAA